MKENILTQMILSLMMMADLSLRKGKRRNQYFPMRMMLYNAKQSILIYIYIYTCRSQYKINLNLSWQNLSVEKEYFFFFLFRALQEAQDIFGVDFDYDEFGKYAEEDYEEEEEEEEEDEYLDDDVDAERPRRPKKQLKKKTTRKSIFEIYEPSELKRGHFTDMDNEV